MKIFHFTDRGLVRPVNEDAFWMVGELGLFMVSDGIGSGGHGAEASKTAVAACRDTLKGAPRPEELLPTLVRRANNALYEMAHDHGGSFGATMAVLWIRGREALFAWVGDSRIYRLRQEKLERLTADHTRAQELTARGAAPAGAAATKSALTKSLGQGPTVDFDHGGPIEVAVGDLFMVATDGVTDVLSDEDLRGFLAKGPIAGSAAIRQAALERGGPDNLTAMLVEVEPPDLERNLDAARIAAVLKDAASRDAIKSSRMAAAVPAPVPAAAAPAKPAGIGAFFREIFSRGSKRIALEVMLFAFFLCFAFLTPELLAMMGRRLESVSPAWWMLAGTILYLFVVKLRAG